MLIKMRGVKPDDDKGRCIEPYLFLNIDSDDPIECIVPISRDTSYIQYTGSEGIPMGYEVRESADQLARLINDIQKGRPVVWWEKRTEFENSGWAPELSRIK